ncbi:MAG: hypothetical protein RIR18_1521 [Pseudomonadota bacterium]|jgi:ribonuclease BN (tRNA processing enzyme)
MNINLKILGCSGGIGGQGMRTTSLLLGEKILIDAGTGVGDLSLGEMAKIDHVFLTHAHLDHVAALPLMLDSVFGMNPKPLQVFAPLEVIEALRKHIFNWTIWPDFSVIPFAEAPCVSFIPFDLGSVFPFEGGEIRALPVNHHVPAVAYEIRTPKGSTVFSGDTRVSPTFLQALKEIPLLRSLIVECAFPNQEKALAERSGHFCPDSLCEWLGDFSVEQLCITHLKPQLADQTMREVERLFAGRAGMRLVRLQQGAVLEV